MTKKAVKMEVKALNQDQNKTMTLMVKFKKILKRKKQNKYNKRIKKMNKKRNHLMKKIQMMKRIQKFLRVILQRIKIKKKEVNSNQQMIIYKIL